MNTGRTQSARGPVAPVRRASRSARNRTAANFANSDGWIRSGPRPIHRAEPAVTVPIPRTSTATSITSVPMKTGTARRRQSCRSRRDRGDEHERAEGRPHTLMLEHRPRRPGAGDRFHGRARQHHDETEDGEPDDEGGERRPRRGERRRPPLTDPRRRASARQRCRHGSCPERRQNRRRDVGARLPARRAAASVSPRRAAR